MDGYQKNSKCIWLTGLSGAGKSTLAKALMQEFEKLEIPVVLLDGDIIRRGLSNDLGFTIAERKENIRRVAEIAKLLVDSGVHAICPLISPTIELRMMAKSIIGLKNFIEIYVDTPLGTCIERDAKGLYIKALKGEIENFTGIGSPYEAPTSPDLNINTENSVHESVKTLFNFIDLNIQLIELSVTK